MRTAAARILAILVASTRLRRRKKIVTNCSNPNFSIDVPIAFFFNCMLSEPQMFGNVRIWLCRLVFHGDEVANSCPGLHWSRLWSLYEKSIDMSESKY